MAEAGASVETSQATPERDGGESGARQGIAATVPGADHAPAATTASGASPSPATADERQAVTPAPAEAPLQPIDVDISNELLSIPAGAIAGDGSHDCPEGFPIKGNASSNIYHEPESASYSQTIPEFCFASSAEAEAAGFRASRT
jgi:large subunit ribosomal protein L17